MFQETTTALIPAATVQSRFPSQLCTQPREIGGTFSPRGWTFQYSFSHDEAKRGSSKRRLLLALIAVAEQIQLTLCFMYRRLPKRHVNHHKTGFYLPLSPNELHLATTTIPYNLLSLASHILLSFSPAVGAEGAMGFCSAKEHCSHPISTPALLHKYANIQSKTKRQLKHCQL